MVAAAAIRPALAAHVRCGLFGLALVAAAFATPAGRAQTGPAVAQRSDVQWLEAIEHAARRINYSGTIFYQQGGNVRVSRIVHQFDGSVSRERLRFLDGDPREFIRRADEVQCLLPEAKRVVIERRPGGNFPALSTASAADILRHYTLRQGAIERVADSDCQVIHLDPKDGLRYGYRLWVERATGLLLRAQMLNDQQEVVEQMAFTEVHIGEPLDPARIKPSWSTEGWRVERIESRPAETLNGWSLSAPDGFRPLSTVKRRLQRGGGREALQAVYSDGLASFSVFIETDPGGSSVVVAQSKGPLNAFVRRVGDTLVTVVGEVPAATVRDVALSVEARPAR